MLERAGPLLVLSLAWMNSAAAADRFESIREYIRTELREQTVPSIAVAVAKDGKIVWEQGFGWADRERRIPATEHTAYALASVSKPITTTGVMTLVQAGKIDLDRPANDYLGNAKLLAHIGDARAATIRRLANHTSGLPLHFQYFFADEAASRPSMDQTILRYGVLLRPAGERTQYSNVGFGVLDYVIERVSGMSYAEFMRREVFLPLGMTRTWVGVGQGVDTQEATRYDAAQLPLPAMDSDSRGADSVVSSAHDLVRFGMFHVKAHLPDQKQILSDASIDEMQRRTGGRNFYAPQLERAGFGVGFDIDDSVPGYRIVQHDGGMNGVTARLQTFPQQGLALAVIANSGTDLVFSVAERIVATMLPGRKAVAAAEQAPALPIPSTLFGTWRGSIATYVREEPVELRFLPNGDVHVKVGDQLPALVDQPRFENGVFTGWAMAKIETPDTARYAYKLWIDVSLRGDVINGPVTAHTDRRGARMGGALTHWLEVRKDK